MRYLHADTSNLTLSDLQSNPLLVYLSLARCGLGDARGLGESHNLPNLLFLNLSYNLCTRIGVSLFHSLPQLRNLSLTGNPVTRLIGSSATAPLVSIEGLHLSSTRLEHLNASMIGSMFPNLQVLNLSYSGVRSVDGDGFRQMLRLQVMDLRGCSVEEISREMF
jgi:Leucine-rich repeat (LRR) protein